MTTQHDKAKRWSLKSLLLLCGALPIWLFLIVVVPQTTGWGASTSRFFIAPVILVGITAAMHRLLCSCRDAWSLSALFAAVIALASLSLAAWMA